MFTDIGGDTFRIAVASVLKLCGEAVSQGQSLSMHAAQLDTLYSSLGTILSKQSQIFQYLEHQMQDVIQLGTLFIFSLFIHVFILYYIFVGLIMFLISARTIDALSARTRSIQVDLLLLWKFGTCASYRFVTARSCFDTQLYSLHR